VSKADRRTGGRADGLTDRAINAPLRLCALAFIAILLPSRTSAQSDPRLVAAVRLAQDGLSDSARAVAGRILGATQPTDSLYPEALYTMGLLAATEQDRRLYLRRVAVDYTQSAWADDALLQLAQLDYSSGNAGASVRQLDQLLRDYPGSPLTAQAAFWGARAASDRRESALACRMADLGLAAVGDDIELRNQLEFQKQRCQGLGAMTAESTRAAVADSVARALADSLARARTDSIASARRSARPPVRPTQRSSARPAGYYVQVSAVKTRAAADADAARIRRAGQTPVVTQEGAYLKVRAGAFSTREAAAAAAAELAKKLGGRPFVVRVP
jgi:cell division septation protein DedD